MPLKKRISWFRKKIKKKKANANPKKTNNFLTSTFVSIIYPYKNNNKSLLSLCQAKIIKNHIFNYSTKIGFNVA
jgi:hypothetical protein